MNDGRGARAIAATRTKQPEVNGAGQARHVAIVSDGSARWAHAGGLSIAAGHEAAADNVLARISDAIELGIEQLTLYAFSTENWSRPESEVRTLVAMLAERVTADTPALDAQGVRVRFIGRRDRAGRALAQAIKSAEKMTQHNTGLEVFVAFDYGGRDEIVRAAGRYRGGGAREFSRLMQSGGPNDPELLIRAGGEQRLSNFLLWQAAYSELIFRDELWPDFGRDAFEECLAEYRARQRRFGGREAAAGRIGPPASTPGGVLRERAVAVTRPTR
jgi:undecaprenyl diphosphate synthase